MKHSKYISDIIEDISRGEVIRKRCASIATYIGLVEGILLLFYYSNYSLNLHSWSSLVLAGGVGLILYSLYRLFFKKEYHYLPTGKRLLRNFVYVNEDHVSSLLHSFHEASIQDLLSYQTNSYSRIMMDVWHTSDKKVFYCQLTQYKDYQVIPISPVRKIMRHI